MRTMLTILGVVSIVVVVGGVVSPQLISSQLIFPAAIVLIACVLFAHAFPALIYRGPRDRLAEAERAIRTSGNPLAELLAGGRIGRLEFRGPLLRARVYPAGLVIRPFLLTPFAVAASEIVAVRYRREWWGSSVEIAHRSPHVISPLQLGCARGHPFLAALRTIAPEPTWQEAS